MTDGIGAAASGQFLGQYSGVNNQTIDQLIQADSIPMNLMQNQVSTLQSQEAAWGDVRTSLNNFLIDVQALQNPDTYSSKVANSTNNNIATISGDDTAEVGSHDIIVKQLATASKWTGARVNLVADSKTSLNLSGNLVLDLTPQTENVTGTDNQATTVNPFGLPAPTNSDGSATGAPAPTTSKVTINVQPNDSLTTIVEQINAQTKQSDLQASIVDNHLVLTSTQTGKAQISVDSTSTGSLTNGLGLATAQDAKNQGQASLFSLDGLPIARTTNNVSDVLDGATITLSGVSDSTGTGNDATPTVTTLSLTDDSKKFEAAVNTMVTQYNSLMGVIGTDLDPGDPTKSDNQPGSLVGDTNLTALQEELQTMVTGSSSTGDPNSAYNSADSVGISFTDKNGTLGLDTDTFEKALAANPDAVKKFFYQADVDAKVGITTNQRGYAVDLGNLANKYLVNSTGNQGIIALQTAGYNDTIKDLNDQISNFQDQLTAKRAEYVAQFSALDSYMAQAQSQMTYFTQQMGSA